MWPFYSKKEILSVSKVLRSGKVNYWTGSECRVFENEFAKFSDSKYAIALANGTVALDLALLTLGIRKGDEVIVTSRTFIASVSSIINAGAKPIFCDVSHNSQNIDANKIEKHVTKKTKAIMCVHLAGWPCDMDEINKIARKFNIYVIEDCAQAHGARYKGQSVGSLGDIGCWSFCQDKIISTGGEGGMVTTNNKALWEKMWAYKDHGKSFKAVYKKKHPKGFKWLHESFGTNWRMIEIQAVLGRIQLTKMNAWTVKRNLYQNLIWDAASKLPALRVPSFRCQSCNGCNNAGCIHAAYKCYVFINKDKLQPKWNRDKIIEAINQRGVECFSGSCSEVYLEKAFSNTNYRPKHRLPVAQELGETSIMFLIHPTKKKKDILKSCNVLTEVISLATK